MEQKTILVRVNADAHAYMRSMTRDAKTTHAKLINEMIIAHAAQNGVTLTPYVRPARGRAVDKVEATEPT